MIATSETFARLIERARELDGQPALDFIREVHLHHLMPWIPSEPVARDILAHVATPTENRWGRRCRKLYRRAGLRAWDVAISAGACTEGAKKTWRRGTLATPPVWPEGSETAQARWDALWGAGFAAMLDEGEVLVSAWWALKDSGHPTDRFEQEIEALLVRLERAA